MVIDRNTRIPFGKKGGPLKGKTLAQLENDSLEWLIDNAQEADWMRAAQQELSDRQSGLRAPDAANSAPGAPQGGGPGYPGTEAPPPYNAGKESKWDVLPLPAGPAGMAGKHTLDTLVLATHYAFSKLLVMGWPRTHGTAEAAEKLAVSAVIACTDRGIDLLQELQASGQMPKALVPEEESSDLPF